MSKYIVKNSRAFNIFVALKIINAPHRYVNLIAVLLFLVLSGCASKSSDDNYKIIQKIEVTPLLADPAIDNTIPQNTQVDNSGILQMYDDSESEFSKFYKKQIAHWDSYIDGQDDGWEKMAESEEQSWEDFARQQENQWDTYSDGQSKSWQDHAQREKHQWDNYVVKIESKWGNFRGSTRHEWVDYSEDNTGRSYVDFLKGNMVLEVLVNSDATNKKQMASQLLEKVAESTLNKKDFDGESILKQQIVDKSITKITIQNPVQRGEVTGKDGVKRTKYAISTKLVKEHLKIRAERYMPLILKYCNEFNLEIPLVLAIIETESYFNPLAKSWANAYGLMQIVPKYAGRETWQEIYGQDVTPTGEYLFNAENNIRHGSCYLNLLMTRYWKELPDGKKKIYSVVCSYNCGPHNVNRMVIAKHGGPKEHSEQEWFNLLVRYTPKETQNYLRRVIDKKQKWISQ